MTSFPILFFFLLVACLGTCLSTPFIFNRLRRRGIVGKDMNKADHPEIPEMGGIAIWLGFMFAVLVAIFFHSYLGGIAINLTMLMAGMLTITIVAFIGVLDDLIGWRKGLRQYQHALLPIFAALPLMAIRVTGEPFSLPLLGLLPAHFVLPFVGTLSFGVLYSLFMVPIGVTGASNATNMLAGLNGLEAGLGILIIGTLFIISAMGQQAEAALLSGTMVGALIGFIIFNWYPAKVFGGDSLTLMVGATVATVSILGNMEKIGVILMALYFIELYLKARSKFQADSFGAPRPDGTLVPPTQSASLTHVIMKTGRLSEKQVTVRLLALQAFVCLVGFGIYYLNSIDVIHL